MELKTVRKKEEVRLVLSGDLDSHGAAQIREKIDGILLDRSIRILTFDMKDVPFMDSSGIGLVLARALVMQRRGGTTRVIRTNRQTERVLRLSGVYRIAEGGEAE